jgi:cytidine deaminase
MDEKELVQIARNVRDNAYCEYSDFSVGAALLTEDGSIYEGVNMENINLSGTIHAEGNAISSAIADGYGAGDFVAIAVTSETGVPPCGRCRQTLSEFCQDITIIIDDGEDYTVTTLCSIFPNQMESL